MTFSFTFGFWIIPTLVTIACVVSYFRVQVRPRGVNATLDVGLNVIKAMVFAMISLIAWQAYWTLL